MKDVVINVIPKMQTTTFVTSDPKNFDFIGSIPEVMLARVLLDNDIIKAYWTLQATGGVPKKQKQQKKQKYKRTVINADSDDQTQSKVMGEDCFVHEEDTTYTSEVPFKTFEPIASNEILKVSTPLSTPPESDVNENILKEPIINLSQTPTPPLLISTSVPIESSIPRIPKLVLEPTSTVQTTLPFQYPIFTNSTTTPIVS
ncbi:unnamed protein product [Lactuca virosa]|uniref:Uncharacterized protein n=1 Tax=Lactuca virosa TaxID=75947 RepID=A0AAU9N4B7_9ASTR|nr:unnamed protein product [Lactuca virosa]